MYSIYADKVCIYNDLNPSGLVNTLTPKLKMSDNNAGSLEITLPVGNIGYDVVERLKTEIIVKRFDEDIWAGRVISEKKNFQNSRILTCEGELAYFNDTTQPPAEYDDTTIYDFLTAIINVHNNKISSDKQIEIREVTVHGEIDPDTGLETNFRFVTNNETTLKAISEQLVDKFGGHIRIRRAYDENNILHRYLDYLAEYPNTSAQEIRFGRNLLDFTKSWDMSEYATVIMPKGAKLDSSPIEDIDAYLDVSSVNAGSRYVTNEDAIREHGWIEKVVEWDEITDAEELLQKARKYLSEEQFDDMILEISAIDLRYLLQNEASINLLDQVRCVSRPHGLDKIFPVTELSIQLDSPENSKYTLGSKESVNTLTGSTREANKDILERLKKIPTERSILDKAKENATAIMDSATNGYITIVKDATTNTHSESLIISDTADYTVATRYWKWNVNGLGYYGPNSIYEQDGTTLKMAMTMDGAIVADYITAGTMSADRIRTGILESSEEYDAWNNTTFYWTASKDKVKHNNKSWKVITANSGKEPGVTAWIETQTATGATDWSSSTTYSIGAIVSYNDKYWIAQINNKGYRPGTTYWTEITSKNVVFDLNSGSLTISSGVISLGLNSNGAYNFQVDDDGYLTVEYGKIGGFTISAYSIYNDVIDLNSRGLEFRIKNGNNYDVLGTYGTNKWGLSPTNKGLTVDMEYGNSYIAWGHKDNSSDSVYTVKLMYTSVNLPYNTPQPERGKYEKDSFTADRINLGCDLDGNNYSAHYLIIDPSTCRILKDDQNEGATSTGKSNNVFIPTFIPPGLGITWDVWKMKNGLIYKST